jgi:hypothetical protein
VNVYAVRTLLKTKNFSRFFDLKREKRQMRKRLFILVLVSTFMVGVYTTESKGTLEKIEYEAINGMLFYGIFPTGTSGWYYPDGYDEYTALERGMAHSFEPDIRDVVEWNFTWYDPCTEDYMIYEYPYYEYGEYDAFVEEFWTREAVDQDWSLVGSQNHPGTWSIWGSQWLCEVFSIDIPPPEPPEPPPIPEPAEPATIAILVLGGVILRWRRR